MAVARSQIEGGDEPCFTQFSKDLFDLGHGPHLSPCYDIAFCHHHLSVPPRLGLTNWSAFSDDTCLEQLINFISDPVIMFEGQSIRSLCYGQVVTSFDGHFYEKSGSNYLSSSVKASLLSSSSLSKSCLVCLSTGASSKLGFPVVHIVMLGTCLIYLYKVEVLLWKCVDFKSTCPWVSCGDIV